MAQYPFQGTRCSPEIQVSRPFKLTGKKTNRLDCIFMPAKCGMQRRPSTAWFISVSARRNSGNSPWPGIDRNFLFDLFCLFVYKERVIICTPEDTHTFHESFSHPKILKLLLGKRSGSDRACSSAFPPLFFDERIHHLRTLPSLHGRGRRQPVFLIRQETHPHHEGGSFRECTRFNPPE